MGKFNDRMQNFMVGRNGPDTLVRWLLGLAVVLLLINIIIPNVICSMLSYALLFYCIYRMFSSNVPARQSENERFEGFLDRFRKGRGGSSNSGGTGNSSKTVQKGGGQYSGRNQYGAASNGEARKPSQASDKMAFLCEKCGQSLSVPKGRGTLKVTCPKCHHQQKVKS